MVRGLQSERIIKFEKAKQCFENLSTEAIETSMKSIKLPPRMYQGVQFLFFEAIPIFSYFETKTSYFFYFLAGEAKICNKIENGIIVVCVFE